MVQNADLILTKNQIMQKARLLLEQLQDYFITYLKEHQNNLPAEVNTSTPKISRGENYLGLPFLILDYPRCFSKDSIIANEANTFAIRTMFWWGNFFSITLHLSGSYKKLLENNILAGYTLLKKEKFFISVNKEEWEHHFEKNNFERVDALSEKVFVKNIRRNTFIKIAHKIPLTKWDEASAKLSGHFKTLLEITGQLPRR